VPLYDYVCGNCGQRTEVMHGINAPGPEHCPHCGQGPMRKLLAPPAIHFKGTGWAKKERAASLSGSRRSDDSPKESTDKSGASAPDTAKEAKTGEASKPATAPGGASGAGTSASKPGSGEG
jgi:putative FmdB family regulatory protein